MCQARYSGNSNLIAECAGKADVAFIFGRKDLGGFSECGAESSRPVGVWNNRQEVISATMSGLMR
jgi:hypothetical protein